MRGGARRTRPPGGPVRAALTSGGRMACVPEIPDEETRLPPGQYVPRGRPVIHYGRVPAFRPQTWRFQVFGATASGEARDFTWEEFSALPRTTVIADFH